MGRGGKKKGSKDASKEVQESMATLTVSDDAPSTSQPAPAGSGGDGLGLEAEKKTEPAQENPVEPEEDGLGLGGGKKRPKKKKPAAQDAKQSQQQPKQAQGPSAPTQQPGGPPTHPSQQTAQGFPPPQPTYQAGVHPGQPMHVPQVYPPGQFMQQQGFPPGQPMHPPQGFPPGQPMHPPQGIPPGQFMQQQGFPPGQPMHPPQGFPPGQPMHPPQGFPPGQPMHPPQPGQFKQQPGFTPGPPMQHAGAPQGPPVPQAGAAPARQGPPQQPRVSQDPPAQKPATGQAAAVPTATKPQASTPRASSQELHKCRYTIPQRYEGGKVPFTPIRLVVNYLRMEIAEKIIYRYDVSFVPERPKKALPWAFQAVMKKRFPKHLVAFDQIKNFYSVDKLPGVTSTDRVVENVELKDDNGKTMKFEVSLKATGTVDFKTIINYMNSGGTSLNPPSEAIQCVDVVLRQGTLESYIKAGRQFFKRPDKPIPLGDGLEIWTGLFQSAIFTSKPFINIDVAHKGFPIQQPLLDVIDSFRLDKTKPLDQQRGVDGFLQFIKVLRVKARIGGDQTGKAEKREFICNGLAAPPGRLTFPFTDASGKTKQMSVSDYFLYEKKYKLKYPNLNCMWVGHREKKIYYPMELLEVAYGQVRNKQLNERQLSTMVREAATPPGERRRKIEECIRDMNYSRNAHFEKFGLKISDKFTTIDGKILRAPALKCGANKVVTPSRGVWNAEKVLTGKQLAVWGLIAVEPDFKYFNEGMYDQLIKMFQNVGSQMSMSVSAPRVFPKCRVEELQRHMQAAVANQCQMMIVIVSPRNKEHYSKVKKIAELNVGVLTQCLKDQTVANRLNPQTVRNILLKVNSKLMGVNQAIDSSVLPNCLRLPFMCVGADVTHPSPDQSNIPSIAAVTASFDKQAFQYNLEFSIQSPKKEMIVQFEDMMVDHLELFRRTHGRLPANLYVFRDGVSEGQFAEVMNCELQAVYDAFARLAGPGAARPLVLFLLVQKRHHTRFFLERSSNNVEPGTLVDKEIVHPRELDFYLVSHQAIKGTARPTRYHVVANDMKLTHDEVEQLTYYLCHLYSRCTRAVSYPAPTYYAHLACLRARALTQNDQFDNARLEAQPKRLKIMKEVQENSRMFFV